MSYSRKQIIKRVKFISRNSGGMGRIILKKCYQITIIGYTKVGTNKTQMLHRLRLPQFTHRKPLPDVQITSQEWKSDPEVIIKHDGLYARAWENVYERPIFNANDDNTAAPYPPEIAVPSDLPAEEMWNTPGTSR